jgi:hypothetical protein
MGTGRASGGPRDDRGNQTRAFVTAGSCPTPSRSDQAIRRAARVVLGAFWRQRLLSVPICGAQLRAGPWQSDRHDRERVRFDALHGGGNEIVALAQSSRQLR